MKFIAHRINQKHLLQDVSNDIGAEIDVRAWKDKLILAHEPYVFGEELESFLKQYKHSTLILNIKCERIEYKILELLNQYNIDDYIFLDSSIPMINKLSYDNVSNIAVRLSELEPMEQVRKFAGRVKWVWVDCFSHFVLTKEVETEIHQMGFKICLVCPSLQGRPQDIESHLSIINAQKIEIDAVCSKIDHYDQWIL